MENPLVSVVIPAYKAGATIKKAIDSALAQKVKLEILVIDDSPEEDLSEVLRQYPEGIVAHVKNPENLGAARSRNRGVSLARGEYVAFLDADDYWGEGKLSAQLKAMEQTGAVLCCTARELITPEGKSTGRVIPVKEKITYRELLKHNSINCSSVLLKTEAARRFPMGHEDSHEDYIMWLEILKAYGWCCGINEPYLKYRLSTTGKSGNKLKSARMTFRAYRYVGFTPLQASALFCSYALHGVWKYAAAFLGEAHET